MKEGYCYEAYYELVGNQIIQKWNEHKIEEPEEVINEYEQAFNIITQGE